jgi:hypothetical protein
MKGVSKRLNHPVWRTLLALLVLVAGYWVGGFLRTSGSDPQSGRVESPGNKRPAMDRRSTDEQKRSTRTPQDSDDSVRLSRAQWSKLIRDPRLVNVSLLDCLPEIRPANGGVGEFLGGISTTRIVSGSFTSSLPKPELYKHADFFGWSEEQWSLVSGEPLMFHTIQEAIRSARKQDPPDESPVRRSHPPIRQAVERIPCHRIFTNAWVSLSNLEPQPLCLLTISLAGMGTSPNRVSKSFVNGRLWMGKAKRHFRRSSRTLPMSADGGRRGT